MKVISKSGKTYYTSDPLKQKLHSAKYYENNKAELVRKKILNYSLGVLGRIPTLGSIGKYSITPGELIQHFGTFKKNCQDIELLEKSQAKLMTRIEKGWA